MKPSAIVLAGSGAALALAVAGFVPGFAQRASARPPSAAPGDEKAVEVVRGTLDAIERGWALSAYDRAARVRAAVNLRGGQPAVGVTANVVVDRRRRQIRVDAAGDVGPLTLLADGERLLLYVPALQQFARQPTGELAPGELLGADLTTEVGAIRQRLDAGYPLLVYRGRQEIEGDAVEMVEDTPAPGATTTYWIDARSSLPRRVVLSRPGRSDVRLDLAYGTGPRPTRAELTLEGPPGVRASIVPRYDESGRVIRLQATVRTGSGGALTTDLTFDWAPDVGRGFFAFRPPEGSAEVSFQQLASGVMFAAAGRLGALLQLLAGLA